MRINSNNNNSPSFGVSCSPKLVKKIRTCCSHLSAEEIDAFIKTIKKSGSDSTKLTKFQIHTIYGPMQKSSKNRKKRSYEFILTMGFSTGTFFNKKKISSQYSFYNGYPCGKHLGEKATKLIDFVEETYIKARLLDYAGKRLLKSIKPVYDEYDALLTKLKYTYRNKEAFINKVNNKIGTI